MPAQLGPRLEPRSVVVFDTREPGEFLGAHIDGAASLPLEELAPRGGALDAAARERLAAALAASAFSPRATIVVADGEGEVGLRRAATGCWLLSLAGARHCSLLVGGVPAYRAAGGRVQTGRSAPTTAPAPVRVRARPFSLAGIEEVREAISGPGWAFADVRRAPDGGTIPGAFSWPLAETPAPGVPLDLIRLRRSAEAAGLLAERQIIVVGEGLEDGAWGWFLLRHALGVQGARLFPGGHAAWRRAPSLPLAPD